MSSRNAQWKELTLRQVLSLEYGKGLPQRKRISGPYPVVGSGGVTGYHCQPLISGPGIIVGRKGSIGTVYFEKRDFWPIDTVYYVELDTTEHDLRFVYYMLLQLDLNRLNTDAAVPGLNRNVAYGQRCNIPPLPTQHKIAAILSAYDDLIENNTRRIAILEEMAQAIYREWFVHFCFPGHEEVALGPVPEGWEVVKLRSIADVNASSISKRNAPSHINYVTISSVSTGRIERIEPMAFADAPSRARRVVRHGDTIWSTVRPNRKSYCLILDPVPNMIVSTGFAVITPRTTPYTYLHHAVTTHEFAEYLTNHATGAAYPAVNTGDFENADVMLPPSELLHTYHRIVSDFYIEKQILHAKNDVLRRTRDLLLPRLVSGEIKVGRVRIDG